MKKKSAVKEKERGVTKREKLQKQGIPKCRQRPMGGATGGKQKLGGGGEKKKEFVSNQPGDREGGKPDKGKNSRIKPKGTAGSMCGPQLKANTKNCVCHIQHQLKPGTKGDWPTGGMGQRRILLTPTKRRGGGRCKKKRGKLGEGPVLGNYNEGELKIWGKGGGQLLGQKSWKN